QRSPSHSHVSERMRRLSFPPKSTTRLRRASYAAEVPRRFVGGEDSWRHVPAFHSHASAGRGSGPFHPAYNRNPSGARVAGVCWLKHGPLAPLRASESPRTSKTIARLKPLHSGAESRAAASATTPSSVVIRASALPSKGRRSGTRRHAAPFHSHVSSSSVV